MFTPSSFLRAINQRRDPVIIVSEMLSCAVKGVGKCEMMYKVGLSSAQLKKYLLFLLRSELLAECDNDEKTMFKTTAKGRSFLETFDTLIKLLD
jgi:predicted transcriptional regulator